MKFLYNPKTGAIFNYTEALAAVPGVEEISAEAARELLEEQKRISAEKAAALNVLGSAVTGGDVAAAKAEAEAAAAEAEKAREEQVKKRKELADESAKKAVRKARKARRKKAEAEPVAEEPVDLPEPSQGAGVAETANDVTAVETSLDDLLEDY